MRAFSAGLALLCFVLVCFKGLIEGNSFNSVLQHSLVAMLVGAVGGYLAAMAVQYVVKNEFDHQYRVPPVEESSEAPVQPTAPAQAEGPTENASGTRQRSVSAGR